MTATATKPKPKPKAKPKRRLKRSAAKVSGETSDPDPVKWSTSIVQLGVKTTDRHPHNRHPAQASIDETAESIEQHGQLEPCLVRRVGKRYQMISGETRWLSQQQLGSKFYDARIAVDDMSDAKALELVAAANGARNDLDPIQRAELLQQLCLPIDEGGSGLTQAQAGKLMGCGDEKKAMSRSSVANAIRMLKLPPKIREVVASGELPETYARELLPLFDTGFVTELATKAIMNELNTSMVQTDGLPSRLDFAQWVEGEVQDRTKPMDLKAKPDQFYVTRPLDAHYAFFKPTEEQEAELRVIQVGGERRATNVNLWEKLQKEAADALINGKKAKSKSSGKPAKLSAAEEKAKAAKQAKQRETRIADWVQLWKRWWMSHEIEGEAAFRVVISLESSSNGSLCQIMQSVADEDELEIPSRLHQHHTIAAVMQCTLDIETMIRRMAQVILWPKDRQEVSNIWRRELIDDTADDLGFDAEEAWDALLDAGDDDAIALLAEFYIIFSKDMLEDLKTGVVVISSELEDARTKAQLVTALSKSFVAIPPVLNPKPKTKKAKKKTPRKNHG